MVRIHVGQPIRRFTISTARNCRIAMDQTPSNLATPPPAPLSPTSSLPARLMNVVASPGEVFEEVKATRATAANWVVPTILASIIGIAFTLVMFSQPKIQRQIREQQEKAFEEQVKAGKMTQQQADQAMEMTQKFTGPMMKVIGSVSAVFMSFWLVFWRALVLWLIARLLLKVEIHYMKAVEVSALSSMILVLGGIVALLLMVIFGKMFASASLALLVSEFDIKNKMHFLLGAVNLFNIWFVAVMGLGLARLTGASWGKAASFILIYWVVISLALIGIGMGQFAL